MALSVGKTLKSRRVFAEEGDTGPPPVIDSHDQPLETEDASVDAAQTERVPLGRLLVDAGFLTRTQLDDCLFEGSKTGERIGEVVVRRGLATEDDVARLLAEQWGLDYVERSAIWFDGNALTRLSREDAQRLEVLPTRIEGGRVVVAVAEPTEQRLAAIRELLGDETMLIVVPKSALDAGLRSQLLASRGGQFEPSAKTPEPAAPPPPPPPAAVEPEEEPLPPPPRLTAVPPLDAAEPEAAAEVEAEVEAEGEVEAVPAPDEESFVSDLTTIDLDAMLDGDGDSETEAVEALAAEAKAVAERLAAQAAAAKQQRAHQLSELKAQAEAFEERIKVLELELEAKQAKLDALRAQLEGALDLVSD